jgi:hypothetical protein
MVIEWEKEGSLVTFGLARQSMAEEGLVCCQYVDALLAG